METKKNTCFVIMPISDQDGYDKGHFTRVYQHLILPACEKAGFTAIRADDEIKTNYIVIDIIRKIIDSDIVLCDLSSKNPNVLYELGIRQAFNKKSILIKDNKTSRVFDIQGLRTLDYDETLRIDEVQKSITNIAKTLTETFETKNQDINSIIQLLSIKPATVSNSIEISKESSLILEALNDMSNRLYKLEKDRTNTTIEAETNTPYYYDINGYKTLIGQELYEDTKYIGTLVDVHADSIFVENNKKTIKILKTNPRYSKINIVPF